jgi:hypothetical protein
VLMRFIHHIEALRRKRGCKLVGNLGLNLHGTSGMRGCCGGQPPKQHDLLEKPSVKT